MNKSNTFIIAFVSLLGLSLAIYQYVNELQAELASAASSKPANGHIWSEMECNDGLCVTGGDKVGIGATSPEYKLDVGGQINASGGLCIAKDCKTSWSAVGGAWTTSSSNIYNSNTGNVGIGTDSPIKKLEVKGDILSSGDVCSTGGKCLSSMFLTNILIGNNLSCPTGQTMIMKSYLGTWYTADNANITTWDKISCGKVVSGDGSIFLYKDSHTANQCTSAGGKVENDGSSFCRFAASSCPGGWNTYKNWKTTYGSYGCYCFGNFQDYGCYCQSWKNAVPPTTCPMTNWCLSQSHCDCCASSLSCSVVEIGCY